MMKKRLFIILNICLCITLFSTGNNEQKVDEYRVVVDARGEEVRVKKDIQRIATFPIPHPHIISAIDGGVDRIVGAHKMSVSAAKISVFSKIAPGLLDVNTDYLEGQTLNLEELLKVKPDVFFTDKVLQGMENLEESGIPVIYMDLVQEEVGYPASARFVYSPRATMESWVRITSEVLGKDESSASEIDNYWRDTEKEIEDTIARVPEDQRPKILILFQTKTQLVSGEGTFGDYWIAKTGGINAAKVAGKHPAMVKVGNFEDIMNWNPDIVYLTNFEGTMPNDLYNNSIDGQDWSEINAIKNSKVYRIPLGIYRWYPPSLDGPLMLKWMAQKNYPELFDYNMKNELKKYFTEFHHYDLSDDEIDGILDPASSGSL